jgi:hypothetical protein
MSAPFRIVDRYNETMVTLDPRASIRAAIAVCKVYRDHSEPHAHIHGDDIDLDCADGLSREERDAVEAAGL